MSRFANQSLFALALLGAVGAPALSQSCLSASRFEKNTNINHWSSSDNRGWRTTTIRWRRGDCELRVDARGEFSARPDLTAITSVDAGGYLDLEERDGDHTRRVRITNGGGGLEHKWTIDGANGFDVDRERWLGQILVAVERRTAMFVKDRVPLLLRQGGPESVLDEAGRMDADYARKRYYVTLLSSARLNEGQLERMLRETGELMSSDYERGEIVRAVAAQGAMSDRLSRAAIGVAQRMSSDYEKRRALSAGLEAVASVEGRTALFTAASTMSSSYELAELLIAAQRRSLVDSVSSDAYFKAVSRLSSDYERRRTLSSLLKQRPESQPILLGVLRASESINSDYELATLLVEFTRVVAVRGEIRELYLKAARSISSDYEYRRALQALLEQDRRT